MIIDAHTHNFQVGDTSYTEKELLSSMDEAGIDYSLLIATDSTDLSEGGITTDQAVKICEKNPRLHAIGNIDFPTLDNNQMQKLFRYLEKGKIYGIKLYPGYENFYPMDKKLFPLYKECQKRDTPVVFHTGVLVIGSSGLLKQVHPLHIDEVANKFPELTIVMAHVGNPWILDAAAVVAKNKNVFVDLSGFFTEYAPILKEDIDFFVRQLTDFKHFVGNFKKCLFGTDWPLYSQKEYLHAVKQLSFTDEEKDLVFWKNAKDIFHLKI